MTHNTCTVFQTYLKQKIIPWSKITRRLGVDRTATSKWANGVVYPNKQNADELIKLFNEHGFRLDYNDLYQDVEISEAS